MSLTLFGELLRQSAIAILVGFPRPLETGCTFRAFLSGKVSKTVIFLFCIAALLMIEGFVQTLWPMYDISCDMMMF